MTASSPLINAIAGVRHGFGDKSQLMPETLRPWQDTLAIKKQVHGTHIRPVSMPAEQCGQADGVLTATPGLLLSVLTADCLPLLFARRDGKRIGALHAGWRGLLAGIIEEFAGMLSKDDDPANWVAAIGPAAGPCCYEVSESLVENFLQGLPMIPATIVTPAHRRLDLAAIARFKLNAAGFPAVDDIGHCTICTLSGTAGAVNAAGDGATPAGPAFAYTSFRRNSLQRAVDPTYPTISGRNQHAGLVILP
ncbi:polyphenol oxidase family protein [Acerihabitans arboris]|uniref:Polyphenol oxidoreductase n=1 Tax=Acerihabitans arboris TaxID=2691583 RepID=A0A845SMM9_9GAMM|nr:laccase domain-containing protein [Acerihabitans arboris]NDL62505.1 polyphenol oxidoreductase [Acerihabitans arboris]